MEKYKQDFWLDAHKYIMRSISLNLKNIMSLLIIVNKIIIMDINFLINLPIIHNLQNLILI